MNHFNHRIVRPALAAVVIAVVLLGAGMTLAGKPDKPGGGGGGGEDSSTIYVRLARDGILTMNQDGSGQTALPGTFGIAGQPSHNTPNDHRWFLAEEQITTEFYPDAIVAGNDGAERREIVAVPDDGDIQTGVGVVSLTLQPDLEPLHAAGWPEMISAQWGTGDSFISFIGRRWDDDPTSGSFGEVLEGGLYVAEVAYDADGNVAGLVAQPQEPLIPMTLVPVDEANRPQGVTTMAPDIRDYDWSPDGAAVVFDVYTAAELWIAEIGADELRLLHQDPDGDDLIAPRWSPSGNLIAFNHGPNSFDRPVGVIRPDGSRLKTIAQGTPNYSVNGPVVWSPSGGHLLFHRWDHFGGGTDVYRMNSKGGGKTNLTADVPSTAPPMRSLGWR